MFTSGGPLRLRHCSRVSLTFREKFGFCFLFILPVLPKICPRLSIVREVVSDAEVCGVFYDVQPTANANASAGVPRFLFFSFIPTAPLQLKLIIFSFYQRCDTALCNKFTFTC